MTVNLNSSEVGSDPSPAGKGWSSELMIGETAEPGEESPIRESLHGAYNKFLVIANSVAERALSGLADLTHEELELIEELVDIAEETEALMADDPYIEGDGSIKNPIVFGFGPNKDQIVNVVNVKPEEGELTDETQLFMVEGWGANVRNVEPAVNEFVKQGREVISVEAVHRVKTDRVRSMPELVDEGALTDELGILPDDTFKRVDAVLRVLDEMGVEQVDAVGHSQGGMVLAIAATIRPEKFRSLTLVNSAGLIGDDSLTGLVPAFTISTAEEYAQGLDDPKERASLIRAAIEIVKSFRTDSVGLVRQISEISRFQTPELLKILRDQGVKIGVIHPGGDRAFPQKFVKETLESGVPGGISSTGDFVDEVVFDIEGTHGSLYSDEELAREIIGVITRMTIANGDKTNQSQQ